jgi:hypothetical protein
MTEGMTLDRADFDQLVAEHRQLIRLTNELEFQLYQMGEAPGPEQVKECRQAAGALIGLLRQVLFRHDQQVLPLLEGPIARPEE